MYFLGVKIPWIYGRVSAAVDWISHHLSDGQVCKTPTSERRGTFSSSIHALKASFNSLIFVAGKLKIPNKDVPFFITPPSLTHIKNIKDQKYSGNQINFKKIYLVFSDLYLSPPLLKCIYKSMMTHVCIAV